MEKTGGRIARRLYLSRCMCISKQRGRENTHGRQQIESQDKVMRKRQEKVSDASCICGENRTWLAHWLLGNAEGRHDIREGSLLK